jgi:hypothetical protein
MTCCLFLITFLPVSSVPQGTGEHVVTNYEILEKVAGEAIDELVANMPTIPRGSLVYLHRDGGVGGGIDKVFENVLIEKMTDTGLRVAIKDKAEAGDEVSGFEFSYQIIRFTLKYTGIGRSYIIGAKEVERLAEVGIFARLIDLGEGEIVWVGDTQKIFEDKIAYSLLDRVEDPQHDFTRPPRNEIRWSRLVEPVIVTGIVVGLVYLFFSNQDTSN